MRILSLAERAPLRFAMGFGAVKTVAADALVQRYMEGLEEFDRHRLAVFFSFGLIQVGFVQFQLYVNAFGWAFPNAAKFAAAPWAAKLRDAAGLRNLAAQVGFDQFVYHPLCYFPVFYTCKEIIQSGTHKSISLRDAVSTYAANVRDDLQALWRLFIPTACVQFSVMPMHLRVPFAASVGFVWCGILSVRRGAELTTERYGQQLGQQELSRSSSSGMPPSHRGA